MQPFKVTVICFVRVFWSFILNITARHLCNLTRKGNFLRHSSSPRFIFLLILKGTAKSTDSLVPVIYFYHVSENEFAKSKFIQAQIATDADTPLNPYTHSEGLKNTACQIISSCQDSNRVMTNDMRIHLLVLISVQTLEDSVGAQGCQY